MLFSKPSQRTLQWLHVFMMFISCTQLKGYLDDALRLIPKKEFSICKTASCLRTGRKKIYGFILFKKKSQLIKQRSFCELVLIPHYLHTHWGIITCIHVHTITHTHEQPCGIGLPDYFHLVIHILPFKSKEPSAPADRLPTSHSSLDLCKDVWERLSKKKPKTKDFSLWIDWLDACVCVCVYVQLCVNVWCGVSMCLHKHWNMNNSALSPYSADPSLMIYWIENTRVTS